MRRRHLAILLLLLFLVVNIFSLMEMNEQKKNKCDEKTLVTTKTKCRSCALNYEIQCPEGYTKITNSSGIHDCRYYLEIRTFTLSLSGCRHVCRREFQQPQCCQGYWGPDCLECPGGAKSPCNNRGHCFQGIIGNGTCACQKGFGGTSCEKCADDHLFGSNCSSVCSCVHGICNSGITGDGKCMCLSGYKGPSCDQSIPECQALQCPENSRCSVSSAGGNKLECKCLPNYKEDSGQCEPINPCAKQVCDPHADCLYLGPNHHKCICQYGYKGDGQVCIPIDPCQTSFGNCPTESTVCKYDGPGKSHCECKENFRKYVAGLGCSMTNICATNNPCHKYAECTMATPGQTQCICRKGYVGDGYICYGNIMDQIREIDAKPGGQWQGKLISAIELFENAYEWPLNSLGPFTVLIPTNKGFKGINIKDLLSNKESAQYFVKLHIFAGQLDLNGLNNASTVYTLTGKPADILHDEKDNLLRIRIQGEKKKAKIVQGDIVATNGIVHIIDKALDNQEPSFASDKERSILAVLQDKTRYSRFRSILENSAVGPMLDIHPGPSTIFIPTNDALENLRDGTLDYLLSSKGSRKLHELVQYHVIPHTQLEVASLISAGHIKTMAQQFIYFNITDNGQILVNGQPIEETDIIAKNGRIYTISGVLIPPSIMPILPQRCDEEKTEIKMGMCGQCQIVHKNDCPESSKPVASTRSRCLYRDQTHVIYGCAKVCNITKKEPKCCKGFFSPDCNQCPGGFSNPCSGNGQCMDGMKGNGSCICNSGFEGSHCQFCSDPNKYGLRCDKKCLCVYGKCDNHIESDGICLPGSCRSGYTGKLCDTQVFPCGMFLQFCHAHADCMFSNGTMSCVCKPGYEGDGIVCNEADPCANLILHGCNRNAECIRTGPGTHECVCQPGWTGNGRDCSEINNCLLPNFGGCHSNATCLYIGPGQNDCECKEGFRGNGYECKPINSCLEQDEKCHPLAICQLTSSGVWECICSKGYEGDGSVCYGNAIEELSSLSEAAGFNEWVDTAAIKTLLSDMTNVTILVPSRQAIQNMDHDEKAFWMSKDNIPVLTKYHILEGAYTVADLQSLSSSEGLATSLHGNFLSLSKRSGNLSVDGANIVAGDIAATNGIIHVVDKVLTPLKGVSGTLPKLLPRLEQMPDYSIFRGYIMQYNLENEIEAASSYTIFAPSNDAIENYLKNKRSASLDENQIRYHIILKEMLLKNSMHNGMFRETMLGLSFRVGFFIHDDQLYINEAPINYPNVATDKGVIHGLGKVMEIEKNRCDINDTEIITGKCLSCVYPPGCPPGTTPMPGKQEICYYFNFYRKSIRSGCQPKCVKTLITRECCAGFYGSQCEPCPGLVGNSCFGNGICMDGIKGTGICECEVGFQGVACEMCVQGKYGTNCDQECTCVHGKCNSGIKGDGTCECDVGWRGIKCENEIMDDECNKTCHTSANCFLNPGGAAYCKCAAGFEGNGTYCTANNPCEKGNGACSVKAECRRTTPGNRVCVCKGGYTGDGIVCFEINPCLENNGGCDKNAECTHTGPNQAACICSKGYSGNGKSCSYINPCTIKNGGCGENAYCNVSVGSETTCTCKPNYIGDGLTCRGSIFMELARNYNTTRFNGYLMDAAVRDIGGTGPFTIFAPSREAFLAESKVNDWFSKGIMPQILRYHIVSCTGLLYSDLTSDKTITTLQGDQLKITSAQGAVFLNGKAKILISDMICTNGVIHVIDRVLTPQRIQDFPSGQTAARENLKIIAAKNGYIMFYNLIESSGLINLINDRLHQPITLFWPGDKVIRALPKDQQDLLFKMSNKEKLLQYLKFHIIGSAKILAYALPDSDSLKTLQGSDLSVKCGDDDTNIGELFLSERRCKIVQRHLEFDGGIAYGFDCMLTDPVLGGRCDTFITSDFPGECISCYRTFQCPAESKAVGDVQQCTYMVSRRIVSGCRKSCASMVRVPQCCQGYFGNECQACPGGPEAPCNKRGSCDDGYAGTGECTCNSGFNGTSCELCLPGRYGLDCKSCECTEHGQCDEGISGSGQCFCETGWTGRLCETKLASVPVCSPNCSVNAVCKEHNTCQCKPYYSGDGITCTVEEFCKRSNGGCHKNAKCTQTDVRINCTCQKGYKGDGYTCIAINLCADGLNGGCDEHATCTMTGPEKRKCECHDNYLGDGINCEVRKLPVDRCLQDNGQCHADADCADLHFQDLTVGVFHVRSPKGQYKLTFKKANQTCANEGGTIATYNQLLYAQKAMYHLCSAGWLANGKVAYPTAFSAPKCGGGVVGIIDYGVRPNLSETWDVFCYRVKDVNCTCKAGYVGDGFMCSGNLLQVLVSLPTFTNFVSEILTYSNTSGKGQEFLKYLTNLSVKATLFVPNNDGLKKNETLFGRDIEYHLSNNGIFYYEDLTNGTNLQTRIGNRLLITHNGNQEYISSTKETLTKYVDGKAILGWDIVASNGVIHVIAAPLKAPPVPPSLHPAAGTGIFFVILLAIGIIALASYSYFRFKQRTAGFQHFKEKDDIDVTALDKAQSSNVINPNYEKSATAEVSCDSFSQVSDDQQLVISGPHEAF